MLQAEDAQIERRFSRPRWRCRDKLTLIRIRSIYCFIYLGSQQCNPLRDIVAFRLLLGGKQTFGTISTKRRNIRFQCRLEEIKSSKYGQHIESIQTVFRKRRNRCDQGLIRQSNVSACLLNTVMT